MAQLGIPKDLLSSRDSSNIVMDNVELDIKSESRARLK